MKAIRTKYIGATNHRGSRIIAQDSDNNRVSLSWDSDLDDTENHKRAAYALRDKMKWKGELIGGSFGNCDYWVFIN